MDAVTDLHLFGTHKRDASIQWPLDHINPTRVRRLSIEGRCSIKGLHLLDSMFANGELVQITPSTLKLAPMGGYLNGRVFELVNFQFLQQLTATNADYIQLVGIPYILSLGSLLFGYCMLEKLILDLVGTRGLKSLVV